MESNFVCCICHKIPSNVVESACCNSLFCWDCIVEPKSRECPSCQSQLDPATCTENLAVKKIIDSISVSCVFPGCGEKITVAERSAHEATCPNGRTLCPNSELCGILERSQLASHLVVCQYRRIQCHMCEVPLLLLNLQDHLDTDCTEVVTECPNLCPTKMVRKNVAQHIATVCPFSETECPFSTYGCTAKPRRSHVEAHISDDVAFHVKLISTAFNAQQTQINTLREQLAITQEAASTQFPPNNGILYQCDQELTEIFTRVKNGAIWNHPFARQARTFPLPLRIAAGFILFFVLFGIFKWIVGIKLCMMAYKKISSYSSTAQPEVRKLLFFVGMLVCGFIFLRPFVRFLVHIL